MRISSRLSALAAALFVFACGYQHAPVRRIVEINPRGKANLPGQDKNLTREEYQGHLDSVLRIDDARGDTVKLAIFIHGGLNTLNSSEKRAEGLLKDFREDGYQPIFIHWRSGFFTTYREHLFNHRQGEHWNFWGPVGFPFVLVADMGRSVFRLPLFISYQTSSYLKAVDADKLLTPLTGGIFRFPGEKNAETISHHLLHDSLVDYAVGYDHRSGWRKGFQTLTSGVCLGLSLVTSPLFDGMGTPAWEVMKRRTELLMYTSYPIHDFASVDDYERQKEGALSLFMERLTQTIDSLKAAGKTVHPILIGHSMGAIVSNHILSGWPEINFDKVIFMGAACTIKDFQQSVLPYLRDHPRTQFYNYTLHPKAEALESHGFGFGGSGSLLIQIDNLYERPISENTRVLGKWQNLMNGIEFLKEDSTARQIHLVTLPFDNAYPTRHGDFNKRMPKWNRYWRDDFVVPDGDFRVGKARLDREKHPAPVATIPLAAEDGKAP